MAVDWAGLGLERFVAKTATEQTSFRDGRATDEPASEQELLVIYGAPSSDALHVDAEPLTRALFPTLPEFRLDAVCEALGIRERGTAQGLGALMGRLIEEAATLDRDILDLLAHFLGGTTRRVLQALAAMPQGHPPRAVEEPACEKGIPLESAEGALGPGGLVARAHPRFEDRCGQREMARLVEDCLDAGGALLVEGGPGTGKTYAYLVPALARVASHPGERVVVCTRTKQLQEQVYYRDLPFLANEMGVRIRLALLKGRENYLCLRKWDLAVRELTDSLDGASLSRLAPLGRWLFETETGDVDENTAFLSLSGSRELWARLADTAVSCTGVHCPHADECFSIRARRRARQADVVIVNHALLLSDAAAGRKVLGPVDRLIVDEAHALEATARVAFTATLSMHRVARLADTLGPVGGGRRSGWADRAWAVQGEKSGRSAPAASDAAAQAGRLFRGLHANLPNVRRGRLPEPALWADDLVALSGTLQRWEREIEGLMESLKESPELLREGELGLAAVRDLRTTASVLLGAEQAGTVHWFERESDGIDLHVTPLKVAEILPAWLFSGMDSLVLTSATLSTMGGFEYVRDALGIDRAFDSVVEAMVESPFAYTERMRIIAPRDFPSVRDEPDEYAEQLAALLTDLHRELGRNVLVLFTSYELLYNVRRRIHRVVPTLAQGIDGPRGALVEQFRRGEGGGILLGTDSFWEGVDLPGDQLEILVVTRLPFPVPSDPVFAALAADVEQAGRDAFVALSLPLAILRLRQGVGRLIRTTEDRGVVVITDERIHNRGYAKHFCDALPVAIDVVADATAVRREAARWLTA